MPQFNAEDNTLLLVTQEEADAYLAKAKRWLNDPQVSVCFHSIGSARIIVCEFLANQDGKTFYKWRSTSAGDQ